MKVMFFYLLLFSVVSNSAFSESQPRTDSELFRNALTIALESALNEQPFTDDTKISLSYRMSCTPRPETQSLVEALLTESGSYVTDNRQEADLRLEIGIQEARIILTPDHDSFKRAICLTVHVKCLDSSRKILFATERNETLTDIVQTDDLNYIDNSDLFCANANRHMIERKTTTFRTVSLLVFSGILAFFAFQ